MILFPFQNKMFTQIESRISLNVYSGIVPILLKGPECPKFSLYFDYNVMNAIFIYFLFFYMLHTDSVYKSRV